MTQRGMRTTVDDATQLTNISARQGAVRQIVGWTLTVGGLAGGLALALDDSGIAIRLLPVAAIMWGTSWILGGRRQLCAVDATRGREHPTEVISFGVGGDVIEDRTRADAIRDVARSTTVRATVLGVTLSLLVLPL